MKKATVLLGAALFGAVQAWGEAVEVSTWAALKSNLENGYDVRLASDITKDGTYISLDTTGMNVTMDLNGHRVTVLFDCLAKVANTGTDITFTLKDTAGKGLISGILDTEGKPVVGVATMCIAVGKGGTFNFEGGSIMFSRPVEPLARFLFRASST